MFKLSVLRWAFITLMGAGSCGLQSAALAADEGLDFLFRDEAEATQSTNTSEPSDGGTQETKGESGDSNRAGAATDSAPPGESGGYEKVIALDKEEAPSEPPRRPKSRLVEEIVVTAQKREENLQDVPISVQAFSEEKLDALGVTNQQDLTKLVPSLNISSLGGFTTVFLRGIGTDAFLTADPSVATYIDGVYFPFALGLTQDFGVLERIEVLKGPQGTLFGRNATGGALNIITRDPVLNEWDAQVNATVASYPDLHTKAYLNVPIGESLAFSVSPIFATTEHFIQNVSPQQREPLVDDVSQGVRLKMRWAPFDWMDATIAALDLTTDAPSQVVIPSSTNPTLLARALGARDGGSYVPGSDEANLDGCCRQFADNRVYYGTAQFYAPGADIKLIGSYQDIDTGSIFDYDGSEQSIVTLVNPGFGAKIRTAELQFTSNEDTWGSDWWKGIFGLYYFDSSAGHLDTGQDHLVVEVLNSVFSLPNDILQGLNLPSVFDLLGINDFPFRRLFVSAVVDTVSKSAFSQSTFTLTNWLDLTLALRYQVESRELVDSRLGVLGANDQQITLLDRQTAFDQEGNEVGSFTEESTLSPKISFELRPFGNDSLVYLNYQEATKSGTFNGVTTARATFARPESASAWELGFKGSFLQGTLQFNGALFDYELEDLQVQFLAVLTGGSVSFENAEEAHIRGLDFDFVWLIAPHLVDGLALAGGAGWLETAEYTSYPNARGYTNDTGIPTTNADFSGNRIVKTPTFSGNVALSKTWFLGSGQLEVAGDVFFTDAFFNEPSNRAKTIQPAYELYGARIGYLYEPWNLRATLFGQNLTDKYHTRGIQTTDFGDLTTIGVPRTFGVRLAWQF